MSTATPADQLSKLSRVHELPLVPYRFRGIPRAIQLALALSGKINDPGITMRDTGEIFRIPYPRLRRPLQEITDVWIDGWTGETVMITSPRLVRELFDLPEGQVDHEAWKKFLMFLLGAQTPFVLGGADHVRVRRALAAELTPARVETYRQRSVQRLDDMVDELPLHTAVALHDFYTRFTQDIILRAVFGWDDCADLAELRVALYDASRYYSAVKTRRMFAYMLNCSITLNPRKNPADLPRRDDRLSPRFARTGHRLQLRADELIYRKIEELRTRPNDSVAARLIEFGNRENPAWTDKRLRDIIATLLVAGHDTSVVAYSWSTQYLLHNPGPRAELVAEARAGLTDRYAQAVNTEALRMHSPVIGTLPFPAKQNIALGGYRIRKGTFIFAPATPLHHNVHLYPAPETFRPERWFDTKPDRHGFIPFGIGPHRCPGSTFYLVEAGIVMHRLFGRLDMQPCRRRVDRARWMFGTLSRPKSDTEVIISRRRPASQVPWYQPGRDDPPTPLKEALLPPHHDAPEPDTSDRPRCPFRISANT